MRRTTAVIAVIAAFAGAAWAEPGAAQPAAGDRAAPPAQVKPDAACPPDARGTTPGRGGTNAPDLSDKLADSKGVICPPAGVDPAMPVAPPGGGEIKVVPPPGSPGGDQSVQPK